MIYEFPKAKVELVEVNEHLMVKDLISGKNLLFLTKNVPATKMISNLFFGGSL
jgi:hypothetical protein